MRDDDRCAALRHVGHVHRPNVDLAGMAILLDKVKFNEPVAVNIDVNTFDVDAVAKPGLCALHEGIPIGLQAGIGTNSNKA
jgi:hypothetical protein